MPHESKLIALIAIGFVLALTFGFLAARVRLPPLVSYLVFLPALASEVGAEARSLLTG